MTPTIGLPTLPGLHHLRALKHAHVMPAIKAMTALKGQLAMLCLASVISAGAWAQAGGNKEQSLLIDQIKSELQSGQNSQALSTAQQAVRKAPNDYVSHYYLGAALMALQRYDEASAAAQRSASLAPADKRNAVQALLSEIQKRSQGGNLLAEAEQAQQAGLSAKAARLYDRAWQASPQQPELGLRAADLYLDPLNQPLDAGRVLHQVAQAHPDQPTGKSARERLAPLQNQLDAQAKQWLQQAQGQDPAQAMDTLAKAQQIAPRLPGLLMARARVAARGQDRTTLQAAITDLARAKQATAVAIGTLPQMQSWGRDSAFAQFLEDLLGEAEAAKVKQNADPVYQQQQLRLLVGEMVRIPAGEFNMGSNSGDTDERPTHRVSVAAFEIGKYTVTQKQWVAVMGNNPSHFNNCGDDCPVENVSWHDVQQFIERLNAATGRTYRLPSEAEWEYAARAGSTTNYPWGNDIGRNNANCDGCGSRWDNKQPAPVGQFAANAFGLYDMHGNVWQWVQDVWHDGYQGAPSDGSAWISGGDQSRRVLRGGSWNFSPWYLRSAGRGGITPVDRSGSGGFRLARTL